MPTRIEIRDKTAHLLEPKLRDLLRIISGEGPALHWAILEFEAVGNLSPGPHVGEINEIIKRSPSGFLLDWGHLVTIADKLLQAINAVCWLPNGGEPAWRARFRYLRQVRDRDRGRGQ